MISRLIAKQIRKSSKSILLLGPRQTGKTTLIKSLDPDLAVNLADQDQFIEHQADPTLLRSLIESRHAKSIFIDEIQRIPWLTNTVQALIDDNPKLKFYLTGSSARKLKRGKANLLPGRILNYSMGGLSAGEVDYQFDDSVISYGFLPGVYSLKDKRTKEKHLKSYASLYLKEEIQAEALVRSLPTFIRFLSVAAHSAGQFLDLTKLGKLTRIGRTAAASHFEVLEDTMIAYRVGPDPEVGDLVKHPRFFFFDVGVLNALRGSFELSSDRAGALFEHLFFNQLINSGYARDKEVEVNTYRTRGGFEVDMIVKLSKKIFGIELKATKKLISSDFDSLKKLKETYPKKINLYLAYRGNTETKRDGIWALPWQKVIKEIGL